MRQGLRKAAGDPSIPGTKPAERAVSAIAAAALLLVSPAVGAQDEPFVPSDFEADEQREMEPLHEPVPATQTPDECDRHEQGEQAIQEKSQEVLRSWSCHTFRWFDSWFGDEYAYDEKEVNGWITAGGEWRDYDGFDGRLRLKVRAPLPNMSRRWDIWLGRFDEESYVNDTMGQGGGFYTPGVIDRSEDDEWLLGLGHRRGGRKQGWDWNVGMRLRLPPEPYAKVSYFYYHKPGAATDLRLRQTFFWRGDEHGFGTTSRADLTWGIGNQDVMRWEGTSTWSEDTEGARVYLGQTWYHLMPNGSAYSLLAFARMESERDVRLRDAGLNLIWRFPFTRDYIYLSMGPSLTWPRNHVEDRREANLGFGVWVEMEFGDWTY